MTLSPETKIERSAIENELIHLLRGTLTNPSELTSETNLIADLGLESVQIIEYLCEVEDHFDLAINEDALADTKTIADLAAVVEKLANRRSSNES